MAYNDGLIALHVQMYEMAVDHRLTICQDCGKWTDREFFECCQACGSAHVHHHYEEGNTKMLLHLCKTKLGQTNAALNRQSEQPKIEEAKEMTPEEAEKNLEKLISYLNAEYGEDGKAEA